MTRCRSWVLTDTAHELWQDSFAVSHATLRLNAAPGWSIHKRTLRGGLQDGVEVIDIHNGALSVAVAPTRGMNLLRGDYRGMFLGWAAPVRGPVHPRHVPLSDRGGLGWLAGFDELLCRCGLASNGPPGEDVHTDKAGRVHRETLTLHGRIANQPAHYVEIRINLDPPHELSVVGQVEEGGLFSPRLQLTTTLSTVPGSNRLVIHDVVENHGGTPAEMQLLYHLNMGPPLLEAGSRFLAPIRQLAPRDAQSAESLAMWESFAGPLAGFAEQCFYCDLAADATGHSLAMLYNCTASKAVVVRLNQRELPCFSVWHNTAALADGYVAGLEPGTNYPNFRGFERQHERIRLLPPGGRWECTWSLEVFDTASAVAAIQVEIANLQAHTPATVHKKPHGLFSPLA